MTTGCVCKNPGFCERHNTNKNPHFFKLCQTNERYFKMWEECRGPGQSFTDCAKSSHKREEIVLPEQKPPCQACQKAAVPTQEELKENLPSLFQQAKTLAKETSNHVINGSKNVEETLLETRLAICNECPFMIKDQQRCGKCGCFLKVKAKWESSKCPIGRWP